MGFWGGEKNKIVSFAAKLSRAKVENPEREKTEELKHVVIYTYFRVSGRQKRS